MDNLCDTKLTPEQFVIAGIGESVTDNIGRPRVSYWKDAWYRLKQDKLALVSLVILSLLVLLCIFGPMISGYSFEEIDPNAIKQGPNQTHWFGTDDLGRDLFARVWIGGRVSMIIGFVAAFVDSAIGSLYGGIAAYFGGKVDMILMRISEIISAVPWLIVVIVLSMVFQEKSLKTLILAMIATGWSPIARLVRGKMLQIRSMEFVMAAQGLGVKPLRIILRHMIPNMMSVVIVAITFDIPGYIFGESFLSFIGLGIQPPNTSWGALAAAGTGNLRFYPYQLFFPALMIALTMLGFALFGDGLRDALDPRLRK